MRSKLGVFQRALHFSCRKSHIAKNTSNDSSKFSELHVEIQTCGEIYEKWRKEKRYRNVPKGNLDFNITYIDTNVVDGFREIRSNEINNKPVAVVLHGAPGSYRDFCSLTSHLHENGVRVVVPNLPVDANCVSLVGSGYVPHNFHFTDFTVYKPGTFRHTPEEKAQLIKNFLQEINIRKIDMLICHSSAVYPSLTLCAEKDFPEIRSLAMLNPGAFDIVRAITPYRAVRLVVRISEFPIGMKFLQFAGVPILKLIRVRVRLDNIMDPLLSATTMINADLPKAKDHLETLSSKKMPIFLAFGEDDKLIDKNKSYDMAYLLGASDEDIFHYDENGKLDHMGSETPFLKVMAFKEGSHYVFWKHPDIVNETLTSFLLKVINEQR